jgi:hypothetical protein
MIVLLTAFTLFHLVAGTASLGMAVRLLTDEERARWRSKRGLLIAESISWVYPALGLIFAGLAWADYAAGRHEAVPIILAPLAWLIAMGVVFAIVDFAEDGILGNARIKSRESS